MIRFNPSRISCSKIDFHDVTFRELQLSHHDMTNLKIVTSTSRRGSVKISHDLHMRHNANRGFVANIMLLFYNHKSDSQELHLRQSCLSTTNYIILHWVRNTEYTWLKSINRLINKMIQRVPRVRFALYAKKL